jgi:hypothetical protein
MKQEKEVGYYDPTPKKETLKQIAEKFAKGVDGVIVKGTYVYTENDLRKACSLIFLSLGDGGDITTDEVIQSINQLKLQEFKSE